MNKKSFKDNTAAIDRFFSEPQPNREPIAQEPLNEGIPQQTYYRMNLRLRSKYKEYLENESWKARKSVTEYINDLIEMDMNTKDT